MRKLLKRGTESRGQIELALARKHPRKRMRDGDRIVIQQKSKKAFR